MRYIQIPVADEVGDMTDEAISQLMGMEKLMTGWFKAIKDEALRRVNEDGATIPGWQLAAGRRSRDWIDEATAVKGMAAVGINDPYEHKIKSVPAVEKELSEFDQEALSKFWQWHAGKPSLKQTTGSKVAKTNLGAMAEVVKDPIPKTPNW